MAKKHIILFLICLMTPASIAYAGSEGFTVAGEIRFSESGNLFVQLVTKEQFMGNEKKGEGRTSPIGMIIPIGEEDQKAKKASFTFKDVPTGTYGIRVFQDVNGNKNLDIGLFGPTEPWGMHRPKRPKFRGPTFEEIAFEVNRDMVDVMIELK